jgi:hypothetical protein
MKGLCILYDITFIRTYATIVSTIYVLLCQIVETMVV